MGLLCVGGTKNYLNDLGDQNKMAAKPIYGKNPSSLEPMSQWPWDLVSSIGDIDLS